MSHQTRIGKLASETAVYGVSSIFGRLINFLLFPFYSNVFPPDVFEPVILIYTAFVFLNILYQYGMESAYLKYAADSDSDRSRSATFSTAVWSLLATSVLLSAAILLFKPQFELLIGLQDRDLSLLWYAAGILLLDTLNVVPYAELRLQNRPWRFAIIRTVGILVNVGLNLGLILGADMGIEAIFIANIAASGVSFLLLTPVFAARLRFSFNRPLMRRLLHFGLPFVPGGLGYALSQYVNIFFLERLSPEQIIRLYGHDSAIRQLAGRAEELGPTVYADHIVGAYGGIIKLAVILALVVQMFRYAWQPFFLQHDRDPDAPQLFSRVFTLLTAALLFVYLGISFFAYELVSLPLPGDRFLVAPGYWVGLSVIPIVLLGFVFQGWYYHFSAGAYIKNKTRYFINCTLVGSAVAVTLNLLFVPRYGMMAAAWATTASYIVMSVMLFLIVRRFYHVPYAWTRIAGLGGSAALLFFAWFTIPNLQVWWIEALMLIGYAGAAIWITGLSRNLLLSD